ncbi:MAG: Glutaredoxin 3 [Candidatus Omnitrophica bacterium]|nr:Glutaredoxin 3 [Candidatus Omnitrophota bacterium]
MADVVIYTATYCSYCHAAKKLLTDKGVRYREIDVTDDADERRQLVEKSGGRETVPQIFADGRHIGGYDDLVRYYREGHTL